MKLKNKAFSFVEMIIILAVMGILSAVLVPLVGQHMSASSITRAQADVVTLTHALERFQLDTGVTPTRGVGASPSDNDATQMPLTTGGATPNIAAHLISNSLIVPYNNWNGPYLPKMPIDPWDQGYQVTTRGFCPIASLTTAHFVWVVSGGSNRTVETTDLTIPSVVDPTQPQRKAGSPVLGDVGTTLLENRIPVGQTNVPCRTYN